MTWLFLRDVDAFFLSIRLGAFTVALHGGMGTGTGTDVSGSVHLISHHLIYLFSLVLAVVFVVSTFTFV